MNRQWPNLQEEPGRAGDVENANVHYDRQLQSERLWQRKMVDVEES
jgi:hypothetical protein